MIKGVEHIGIAVKDLEASIKFYCDTLGLEFVERHELPHVKIGFVKAGEDKIELLEYADEQVPETEGPVNHLALQVTDIDKMISKVKQVEGVEILSDEPREVFGGSKIFFFKGPNGEKIELFQRG